MSLGGEQRQEMGVCVLHAPQLRGEPDPDLQTMTSVDIHLGVVASHTILIIAPARRSSTSCSTGNLDKLRNQEKCPESQKKCRQDENTLIPVSKISGIILPLYGLQNLL